MVAGILAVWMTLRPLAMAASFAAITDAQQQLPSRQNAAAPCWRSPHRLVEITRRVGVDAVHSAKNETGISPRCKRKNRGRARCDTSPA
jgi:hypothetical protein